MTSAREMQPRGWYLAADAGRLVGVSGAQIGQWAHYGYIRASRSDGKPKVYSFQDIAEAIVVHDLLDQHFDYREIRQTIENCYEEYGQWPLTTAPLRTASRLSKSILLQRGETLVDISRGAGTQGWLLQKEELQSVVHRLRRGGWATRQHPEITHIEVDPDRLSGQPAIRDTRVPVDIVAEIAAKQGGLKILKADYALTQAQVSDAFLWRRTVDTFERLAA